jgi:hypothetical protein
MTDLVSVCSSITFGNETETFVLPFPLILEPALILDETEGVYRISIGMLNEPLNDAAEEYQRLFNALDKRMPFVENMHISVADEELTFKLAYVMRYRKPYGTFYEIEATQKDLKYKGRE